MKVYYAQNREDLLIRAFFPDVKQGFYIDVGANHPVYDSVTMLFYEAGWSGINVEPIPRLHQLLETDRPRDINLMVGVGSTPGVLGFTEYPEGSGLSTFEPTMVDKYSHGDPGHITASLLRYNVPIVTLDQIVREHAVDHVHFLKIDVEGFEHAVIAGFSWDDVRPELLCIEAQHIVEDWNGQLIEHGYSEVFFDGLNRYYLAREAMSRADFFDYPAAVLAEGRVHLSVLEAVHAQVEQEFSVVGQRNAAAMIDSEARAEDAERRASALLERTANLERRVDEMNALGQSELVLLSQLRHQQRVLRYLLGRLAAEIETRLYERAKTRLPQLKHTYRSDPEIARALNDRSMNVPEMLSFIRKRDRANIIGGALSLRDRIAPIAWRYVARAYTMALKIGVRVMAKVW